MPDPTEAPPVWHPHVWHKCAEHGHLSSSEDAPCLACEGGLGGCVVCGQWEGEIRDYERCPGARGQSFPAFQRLIAYHHNVHPVFVQAKADELYSQRFVVTRDGADAPWRNVWTVSQASPDGWCELWSPTEGTTSFPIDKVGVYDPYNAEPRRGFEVHNG